MTTALLKKLLLQKGNSSRLWVALLALCIGTTLLFLSVLLWWNFKELLNGKSNNDSLGSTFLTIGKKVTDENMGNTSATLFSSAEIEELKNTKQVQDVGILTANRFPVYAIFSDKVGFATEMFLEAADDKFIDAKPGDWNWQDGDSQVPVIISSDFLNLYNYGFALSQGLPQLSESSIKSVAFELKIGRGVNTLTYRAHVSGFSDRISSVLVPQSFIKYHNEIFAAGSTIAPSRLIIKAKDPSDQDFISYLKSKNYTTNNELLKWNKLRSIVQVVASSTGGLALVIMSISLLVLVLFIELTIAKAEQSLSLLLAIGYSPRYLRKFMTKQFLPPAIAAVVISLGIILVAQVLIAKKVQEFSLILPSLPGWPVFAAFLLVVFLLIITVSRAIQNAIREK
ncbi:MAG: ABC transporter permease [Sphingobacteriales bacterium]|nr:MAG: ABC transporter permease [Sphingobacteriales bacterium]